MTNFYRKLLDVSVHTYSMHSSGSTGIGVRFWETNWLFPSLASTEGECFGEPEKRGLIIWFSLTFLFAWHGDMAAKLLECPLQLWKIEN